VLIGHELCLSNHLTYIKISISSSGVSHVAQRKFFTCLSSFYAFVVDEDLLGANPIIPFRRKYLRQYKDNGSEPRQLISIDQEAMLLNSILYSRDKEFLTQFFKTSMRLGELCSLDAGDLDLQDMSLVLKPTAKRSNRQFFFDHETARMLQAWLASRTDVNSG
jgi:integrase/recombinase XerD